MTLAARIESLLFWKGEPVTVAWLAKTLEKTVEEINTSLGELEVSLSGRGVVLVRKEDEVTLGTTKDMSAVIEKITREELARDLGKAGLETLSIILYRGPLSRKDIDYIRGVNSAFILRNLQIRGLVERIQSEKDSRVMLYKATMDLLTFMGLTKIADLPEYGKVRELIAAFEIESKQDNEKEEAPIDNT
ncbi:MAG TPA: SMC-Scp complex subunit ScpB [Candidatus Paceibacterota bacterium]